MNPVPSPIMLAGIALGLGLGALISACSQLPPRGADSPTRGAAAIPAEPIDTQDPQAMDALLSSLAGKRAVLVGERHDRYDHHLNQLAVIRGLHERGAQVAVGMEFFQEPFQAHLDDYQAGAIDERTMLKRTEYYDRWRYDYRLYRDILAYARAQGIPLVALNAPKELTARVSRVGLAGLTPAERALLPADLVPPDTAYLERLRPIFEQHGQAEPERLRRFAEVQVVWDEHMARVARDYLRASPDRTLVILAGAGHVSAPDAIPGRLSRMLAQDPAVLASGPRGVDSPGQVDYLLAERGIELSPPGRMGVSLSGGEAGIRIDRVDEGTPADRAGLKPGDRLLAIEGEPVPDLTGLKLALLDRSPGERLRVAVERGEPGGRALRLDRVVRLL